jgi:methylphosphotriester-DNA--protein-cysteine methyltransferase
LIYAIAGTRQIETERATDLGRASLAGVLAATSMSERTFRRTFVRETGMTWRAWLGQARIMEAASQLSRGRRMAHVATEVCYPSLSALMPFALADVGAHFAVLMLVCMP